MNGIKLASSCSCHGVVVWDILFLIFFCHFVLFWCSWSTVVMSVFPVSHAQPLTHLGISAVSYVSLTTQLAMYLFIERQKQLPNLYCTLVIALSHHQLHINQSSVFVLSNFCSYQGLKCPNGTFYLIIFPTLYSTFQLFYIIECAWCPYGYRTQHETFLVIVFKCV